MVHRQSLGRKPSLRVTHPKLTVQFNIQFYNSLSTLHVSTVYVKILIRYIHAKKNGGEKIPEIKGGRLGAGFQNSCRPETHTHSSQQQSQVKLLSNLLITDWFTSCQLGLSMIELSLPYRWPVVACGRWPLKNQTTREPLPRRVLDTSSFWKRILQLLPDNSNPKAVIYKKLREAIYPSPKPIFCLKWKVSVNVGIGEG